MLLLTRMYHIDDTIVALSTPPGIGAIGIIRLSGSNAIEIVSGIFKGKNLLQQPTHTLHFGKIMDDKNVVDEVVVGLYKSPKSYTGEDVVEVSCHGSQYILQQIIALCIAKGARMAKAGEFTMRAFLKGKLDLAQAEAVADLIASESASAHDTAIHNLRGGFSEDLKQMREQLIMFSALIELELDFSQEDVAFADRIQLYELINRLMYVTRQLLDSFRLGNVIKNGVSVAIIGKPNAGKSTLLNALLNEERAIVSDIAGTTRDTIEETININGVLFRFIDTAGIREHSTDAIEQIGIERSRDAMRRADVIIYLFDVSDTTLALEKQKQVLEETGNKFLLAGNKIDVADSQEYTLQLAGFPILFISAKNKEHIQELKEALYNLVILEKITQESTIITNARHYSALQDVYTSLSDIKTGMDKELPGDLIALDIRRSLHYLGEITGEITTEDKLDYIFSKFCIGK